MRGVPASFSDAIVAADDRPVIDVAEARRQHEGYRRQLEAAGVTVHLLEPDEAYPDCSFVEDTAVVLSGRALVTRPGAPSRRGEAAPVSTLLQRHVDDIVTMAPPATLDGGDVLELGGVVFVGRSARTNDAGCEALADFAAAGGHTTRLVGFRRALHLKSVVNRLDDRTVLVAPGHLDVAAFGPAVLAIETAPGEAAAANVLGLGGGRVLVPAGHPATLERIASAGFTPIAVDVGEFAKADGGLTCLSVRW